MNGAITVESRKTGVDSRRIIVENSLSRQDKRYESDQATGIYSKNALCKVLRSCLRTASCEDFKASLGFIADIVIPASKPSIPTTIRDSISVKPTIPFFTFLAKETNR